MPGRCLKAVQMRRIVSAAGCRKGQNIPISKGFHELGGDGRSASCLLLATLAHYDLADLKSGPIEN